MSTFAARVVKTDGSADPTKEAERINDALDGLEEDLNHRMKSVQAIYIPSTPGLNGNLILIGTGEMPD